MSEMVKRVALALAKAERMDFNPDRLVNVYSPLARAAIKAMREPTETMVAHAAKQCTFDVEVGYGARIPAIYSAMIDAALSKAGKTE